MFDNPFSMVVAIVLIVSIAGVLRARYRRDRYEQVDEAGPDRQDARRLREEIAALKDRIAVLERIATDRPGSLEREIDSLRTRD